MSDSSKFDGDNMFNRQPVNPRKIELIVCSAGFMAASVGGGADIGKASKIDINNLTGGSISGIKKPSRTPESINYKGRHKFTKESITKQ